MMTETFATPSTADAPPALRGPELGFLGLSLLAFVAVVVLAPLFGQPVAWSGFVPGYAASVGLLGIGIYIRLRKNAERVANLTIALAGYALFGVSMGIFFHLFMPRPDPVWSDLLTRIDHAFGYHWPDAVAWLAETSPMTGVVLSYVYVSSFAQIVAVIVLLAASGRVRALDTMLVTGMIGLILTFGVWQCFPNLTMGAAYTLDPAHEQAIRLITNSAYGAMIGDAAMNGIPVIRMEQILGVVAFPSYHTVMAVLVVWFAWRTWLFWPIVALNIPMIPAIHIHGAHHIMDFLGGIVVFFAALWIADKMVGRLQRA